MNANARESMPAVFHCPKVERAEKTTYLAVVGPDACLLPTQPREPSDVTDDPAFTLLIVEVDDPDAVPWTSPRDADPTLAVKVGRDEFKRHEKGSHVAFVDGSMRSLRGDLPTSTWRAITTIAGGEPLKPGDF